MSTITPRHQRSRPSTNMNAIVLSIALGIIMGGAAAIGGNLVLGLVFLAIMWSLAAFLLVGARYSDTIALLGDDVHEERHVYIHQRAALYTLNILALVVIAAFVLDIARGGDGGPYAFIGFITGFTYVMMLLVLSRRA